MQISKPRVYNFSDPILFLQSELEWKKREDPNFSIRKWAKEMTLEDPALLVALIKGKKRLRPRYLDFLKKGIDLDKTEEMFFLGLIVRKNCLENEDRAVIDRLLNNISPGESTNTKYISQANEEIYSHWLNFAILSGLQIKVFQNETSLVKAFPDCTAEEIHKCIHFLESQGFIGREDDNLFINQLRVMSPTDKRIEAVHAYYRQVLDLAKKAIPIDVNAREFQFFTLSIAEKDIGLFKELIRNLRIKMANVAVHSTKPNVVYQTSIQFFPLTNPSFQPQLAEDKEVLETIQKEILGQPTLS